MSRFPFHARINPTALLLGSLGMNLGLLATFALKPALLPRDAHGFFAREFGNKAPRTALEARPAASPAPARPRAAGVEDFWRTLDSSDLPTLVRNLRTAGFSEAMVRAIVTVRVNERIDLQLNALAASIVDTPFWKPGPDDGATFDKYYSDVERVLTHDRWRSVDELLDTSGSTDRGVDATARLQRQYGDLPLQKIEHIRRIHSDYEEMAAQARKAAREIALPEDDEKQVALARARRADLEALLTPEELADYDLRNSPITVNLRLPLTLMNASEEEFRTIYGVQRPFADLLYPPGGIGPAEIAQSRSEAQRQIAEQLRAALGEARYADYARSSMPEFQNLSRIVRSADVPIENAVRIFELRGGIAEESNRIFDDASQSTDQKRKALQDLAKKIRGQIMEALGSTAGTAYVQLVGWIGHLDRGQALTLESDGRMWNSRSLPPMKSAAPDPTR